MRQRGVALITAIIMVALATVIATRIGTDGAIEQRRTQTLLLLDQGWQVALGAEAWAAEVLKQDTQDGEQDHLAESWAQPIPPLPIDGGEVTGRLEDLQGRFNVNNLVNPDGSPNEAAIEQFERLLDSQEIETRWARIMADWLDVDTVRGIPEGAEDGEYLGQAPPYRAANGPVTSASELMALAGFPREAWLRIAPLVTALPAGTKLNVCTASPETLVALAPGAGDFGNAESLARNRLEGCFPTLDDLRGSIGDADFATLSPLLGESSNWFRAVTVVRIGTAELTLYSLLERGPGGLSRTVLRSQGTE